MIEKPFLTPPAFAITKPTSTPPKLADVIGMRQLVVHPYENPCSAIAAPSCTHDVINAEGVSACTPAA